MSDANDNSTPGAAQSDGPAAAAGGQRLFALRGATTASENSEDAILEASTELLTEILGRNELGPDALVSCIFTCTPDLDAQFPAVAARRIGLDRVPLLCAQEIAVPGSLALTIRVLLHYYAPVGQAASHVYLRKATALRTDITAPQ